MKVCFLLQKIILKYKLVFCFLSVTVVAYITFPLHSLILIFVFPCFRQCVCVDKLLLIVSLSVFVVDLPKLILIVSVCMCRWSIQTVNVCGWSTQISPVLSVCVCVWMMYKKTSLDCQPVWMITNCVCGGTTQTTPDYCCSCTLLKFSHKDTEMCIQSQICCGSV